MNVPADLLYVLARTTGCSIDVKPEAVVRHAIDVSQVALGVCRSLVTLCKQESFESADVGEISTRAEVLLRIVREHEHENPPPTEGAEA